MPELKDLIRRYEERQHPQLGPNHPDYGKPLERESYPNRKRAAVAVAEAREYTPVQLLKAYARQHDERAGGTCRCGLCARLCALVAEARQRGSAVSR